MLGEVFVAIMLCSGRDLLISHHLSRMDTQSSHSMLNGTHVPGLLCAPRGISVRKR